jgi:hypothetical protein
VTRHSAPAAERNKGPILEVLQRVLPAHGLMLEIASGTGQHIVHFAKALPHLRWQPSDADPDALPSIAEWIAHEDLTNVAVPAVLDVGMARWPVERADAILCSNMIHIAPWQATLDLMRGAGHVLPDGGVLFLYGPYKRFGAHTAPSNAAFDADLRARNPAWGVRDLEAVADAAMEHGLALEETVPMPANNFSVVMRKR